MPKILITLAAAVAIAAATLPTAAGEPGHLTPDAPGHRDVALRPTAVEYAVML